MVTAVVLINVQRGLVNETAQRLLEVDGVAEVYSVKGEYDLVALLRFKLRKPRRCGYRACTHYPCYYPHQYVDGFQVLLARGFAAGLGYRCRVIRLK